MLVQLSSHKSDCLVKYLVLFETKGRTLFTRLYADVNILYTHEHVHVDIICITPWEKQTVRCGKYQQQVLSADLIDFT